MYCFNCGEELVDGANFCHVCGTDQKKARQAFENKFSKHKATSSTTPGGSQQKASKKKEDTQVFIPSKEEDEELVSYVKKVDDKLKSQVLNQENLDALSQSDGLSPKDRREDLNPPPPTEKTPIEKKSPPEGQKEASQEDPGPKEPKKKRSLKQIWKDFINEDDHSYSVFSGLNSKEDIKKLEDYKAQKKEERAQGKAPRKKPSFLKAGPLSALKKDQEDPKASGLALRAKEEAEKAASPLDPEDQKEPKKSFFKKPSKKKALSPPEKKAPPKTLDEAKEEAPSKEKTLGPKLFQSLKKGQALYRKGLDRLEALGQKGLILGLVLAILAAYLPFVIAQGQVFLASFFFLVLKLAISYVTIFFASHKALENAELSLGDKDIFYNNFFNWVLCHILVFICFLFYSPASPIGKNILGALTPNVVASLLLYISSALLALFGAWEALDSKRTLHFMAWYTIIFISFELLSKLLYFVLYFISYSL
ncbi:MAG: zinc-ribbon domain-containing protein [Tissierellia bacterium]|nr:zinc-ribbon domain-containing protein [Tissierellia bacterium]